MATCFPNRPSADDANPKDVKPPVIRSLDGGEVALRVKNATDRPRPVSIGLTPPPGVMMPVKEKRIELAAGADASVAFAIPPQVFGSSGVCRMPYRVTVANGAPQAGELAVDLRP